MKLNSENALQWFVRLKDSSLCLSTGHDKLDELLQNSINLKSTTEIYGEPGVGKVELLITIAAKLLMSKDKLNWTVYVFDYNGTFRTDQLLKVMQYFNPIDDKDYYFLQLKRIFIERIYNENELKTAIIHLTNMFKSNRLIPLVLINEIGAILSDTSFNEKEGSFEQDKILKLMREFCSVTGGTILTTNHVVHWRGFPAPGLGNNWINGITSRISLKRNETNGKLFVSVEKKNINVNNIELEYTIDNNRFAENKSIKEELIKTEFIEKDFIKTEFVEEKLIKTEFVEEEILKTDLIRNNLIKIENFNEEIQDNKLM